MNGTGLVDFNFKNNNFSDQDTNTITSYLKYNKAMRETVQGKKYSDQQFEYAQKGKLL